MGRLRRLLALGFATVLFLSLAGCAGPSWSSLVRRCPRPDLGAGFTPYHQAVGNALTAFYGRDPRVLVDHCVPYEEADGRRVYRYSWVHFPEPYKGGEPIGLFDTVCHFTIVVTSPNPSGNGPTDPGAVASGIPLVVSVSIWETISESDKIQTIKDRGDYTATSLGVGTAPVEVLDKLRRVFFPAYLPLSESFWTSFDRVTWRTGMTLDLPAGTGRVLRLAVLEVRSEPGYVDRKYLLTVEPAGSGD